MTVRLAAAEDVLVPGRAVSLPPAARVVYVRRGRLVAHGEDGTACEMAEDSCALFVGALTLEGDGEAWSFELYASGSIAEEPARVVLAVDLPRDPAMPVLLRADRVDFPPGAVTPRHGHAGPGIRRLLFGRLSAELGTTRRRIDAGEAWFESGEEPVVGANIAPASAFVRGMALDPALLGKPTFRAWSEAHAARPRGVAYRPFLDAVVTLPPGGKR
jgi:hypothetical protein